MNDQKLILEPLSRQGYEAGLAQMEQLFDVVFRRRNSARLLRWRYLENPNADVLACVARDPDTGSLVASYSACPVDLVLAGTLLRSALSMTTMTAPAFEGRGLFTKLALRLYLQLQASQYDMVWGFPNANSHRGFVTKLGWRDVYEIPTMSVALESVKTTQLPATCSEVCEDHRFELDYGDIAGANSQLIMVRRTPEYLRWRYRDHPENKYLVYCTVRGGHVSSYCVTKVYGSTEIDIVDLVVASPEEMLLLLAKIVAVGAAQSIKRLNCWAPRHHFCHSVYERTGFRLSAPITYLGGRTLSENGAGWAQLGNYSNWYLQMGDSDVF